MTVYEGITLAELDQALVNKLGAAFVGSDLLSSLVTIDGNPVAVFVDKPDITQVIDRVFPSISIEFQRMLPDRVRMTSYIHDRHENDDGSTRDILHDPEPYTAYYQIHTWARNATHDRDMMDQIIGVFLINDTVVFDSKYWNMRRDNMMNGDLVYGDQQVLHKGYSLVIDFVKLPSAAARTGVPIATEIHNNYYDREGTFDRRLVIDENGVTVEDTEV